MQHTRIVLIKNQSTQYDVLHSFRKGLEKALTRLGVEIELFDLKAFSSQESLRKLYRAPPDCTFAFNGVGPVLNGHFLADTLEIPHIAWLVDSAHYFRCFANSRYTTIISPDETSKDLFSTFGAQKSLFLPHAVDKDLIKDRVEKTIPVAFFGTFIDPQEIEAKWKALVPERMTSLMKPLAERVLAEPKLTYQEALSSLLENEPLFKETLDHAAIDRLFQSFDLYIRALDRLKLLTAFSSLPLHVFGNTISKRGFEDALPKPHRITFHGALSFEKTEEAIARTKVLLNSSPMFKTGAHERIFLALANRCLLVTNDTPWIRKHFDPSDDLLLYQPDSLEEIVEKVRHAIESKERVFGENTREKVLLEHTWDNRAEAIVKDILPLFEEN